MPNNSWIFAVAGLLFCGFLPDNSAASGAHYSVKTWTTEDGLPQNSVIAMTQTRDGYLWLGTLRGLARFDGVRFTVFDEDNTPGLNSSQIVRLFEDSKNNLWIGTETAGVALVKDGRIASVDLGRGTREGRVMSICEDSNGAVWLYTYDGQLARYVNGRVDVWPVGQSNFRSIIMEQSGLMWVGMDQGLVGLNVTAALNSPALPREQFLPVRQKLDFLLASQHGGYWRLADGRIEKWENNHRSQDLGPYPWTNSVIASAACEDEQGNLIVGTAGNPAGNGVFWFNAEGKATQISREQGLSSDQILSLAMDREGSLWVGTDGGGLNRVKREAFNVLEASKGKTVQSVCQDGQGGLWIGYSATTLHHWTEGTVQEFGPTNGLAHWFVEAVFLDQDQQLRVGTAGTAGTYSGGLLELQGTNFSPDPGFQLISHEVWAIHQDRKGRLWVGTQNGLAYQTEEHLWKAITTHDGLSANVVRAIADDTEGNLWVGTEGGGLNCLKDGKITVFGKKGPLLSDDISSLYVDEDGVLWIGTSGSGLGRYYKGKWTRYTTSKGGLISNHIDYLIGDGQGSLWIGSNFGLMRVPKKELNDFAQSLTTSISCRAYGTSEGLPTSECTGGSQPAACRTRDGTLWLPTIKGLVSVNPADLKPNTNPPPVVIESVLIGDQLQDTNGLRAKLPETVIVPAGIEHLEIHYTSLNLADPDSGKARFKYRMEEEHETPAAWIEAGSARFVPFRKLAPGSYHFQVTACNEDGVWNERGTTLGLLVEPFFWQTRWFRGTMAFCLLVLITGMVYYFSTQRLQRQLEGLRQQQALEKERQRIARDIHDQLGANLTQVSMLGEMVESDKDSPEEVESHARQISETARDTSRALDEIVWAVNPSNDTLDGLINYFCKYAQEYLTVAGLRYRLDVPDQLPRTPISPDVRHNVFLASKEAVTNIVKHAKASAVWIRMRLEPTRFVLEIEDNGQGMASMDQERARTRNGLSNMRKRLEEIGGSFTISPGAEGEPLCD